MCSSDLPEEYEVESQQLSNDSPHCCPRRNAYRIGLRQRIPKDCLKSRTHNSQHSSCQNAIQRFWQANCPNHRIHAVVGVGPPSQQFLDDLQRRNKVGAAKSKVDQKEKNANRHQKPQGQSPRICALSAFWGPRLVGHGVNYSPSAILKGGEHTQPLEPRGRAEALTYAQHHS